MDRFDIRGGVRLAGRMTVHGSKNAALPLLAAALLTDEPVVLRDIPDLADIKSMLCLLPRLGCQTEYQRVLDNELPGGVVNLHVTDT
ncbi:MAG TPA: hypothetical protein VEB22_14260, partial [Phycisphaerales bacterium]|nr:hypothetical protein [Phycisphaerales bacterium]